MQQDFSAFETVLKSSDEAGPRAWRRTEGPGRICWRARIDALIVAGVTLGAALLPGTVQGGVEAGAVALSLGLLAYVIRRDRDLVRYARAARWRDEALDGRGIPLSEWRRGSSLAPWPERRHAQQPAGHPAMPLTGVSGDDGVVAQRLAVPGGTDG